MYAWQDGGLVWQEPEAENAHIEITVLDGSDKRFVPGLTVAVTRSFRRDSCRGPMSSRCCGTR